MHQNAAGPQQKYTLDNITDSVYNEIKELIVYPELSRFYNIAIKMIYSDNEQHHKPHFHVYYAEYTASVGIDGELIAGSLPVKQLKLVQAGRQFTKKNDIKRGTRRFATNRLVKLNL